jgi:hypothetical protein
VASAGLEDLEREIARVDLLFEPAAILEETPERVLEMLSTGELDGEPGLQMKPGGVPILHGRTRQRLTHPVGLHGCEIMATWHMEPSRTRG